MESPGVLFQHFYYPTPDMLADHSWWRQTRVQLAELARIGVWGVWHPVCSKGGSGGVSMGYDPYDLYDLGSKDQRGSVATHFGTRDEYLAYVASAHANGLSVIADVVLNHTGGADQAQTNPVMEALGWDDIGDDTKVPTDHFPKNYDPKRDNLRSWTGFNPKGADGKKGSGRFPRDSRHFHPSTLHPDHNSPYHHPDFGSDYCFEAENGYVAKGLIAWAKWFQAQSGVDGFRLDAVKLIEPSFLREFAASVRKSKPYFYLVGEFWDTNPKLLADFQSKTERQMGLFDFGLFYALKDMTEKPDFDLRELLKRRFADRERAVTLVSNHDVDRDQAIDRRRRALPYAILMAMSGQPSVFYKDYFQPDDPPLPETLRQLIAIYNRYAHGPERVRLAEKNTLILERVGNLLAAFHTGPTPRTITVQTDWRSQTLRSLTPSSRDIRTDARGAATFTIPPFGYLFFAPSRPLVPGRQQPAPRLTQQTFEFADDLDLGRLGTTARSVSVTAVAGSVLTATVRGLSAPGRVHLVLRSPSGRVAVAEDSLRVRVASTGVYQLLLTKPSGASDGLLDVSYLAPR